MDRPNNGLIMVYQSNEECGFRGSVRGLGGCAITYIIFLQIQKFRWIFGGGFFWLRRA